MLILSGIIDLPLQKQTCIQLVKGQRSYEKGQCGKGHIDGKRSTWGRSFYGRKVNIGRSWLGKRVIIGREKVTL